MALVPWCDAATNELVRLVGRLPVDAGALGDTTALADRGASARKRSCSASDEGRLCLPTCEFESEVVRWGLCHGATRPEMHWYCCWLGCRSAGAP